MNEKTEFHFGDAPLRVSLKKLLSVFPFINVEDALQDGSTITNFQFGGSRCEVYEVSNLSSFGGCEKISEEFFFTSKDFGWKKYLSHLFFAEHNRNRQLQVARNSFERFVQWRFLELQGGAIVKKVLRSRNAEKKKWVLFSRWVAVKKFYELRSSWSEFQQTFKGSEKFFWVFLARNYLLEFV